MKSDGGRYVNFEAEFLVYMDFRVGLKLIFRVNIQCMNGISYAIRGVALDPLGEAFVAFY